MKVLLAADNAERAGAVGRALAADQGLSMPRLQPGQARVVATHMPRPIVLFAHDDDPGFMEDAIIAGVSSYNVLGLPPPDVKPIPRSKAALFRRHQQAQVGQRQTETRLNERAFVDRAEALLIRRRNPAEPEACRWPRSQAMMRGRRIVEIATDLVRNRERDAP